jgi:tetratricopeptide (TPR) repeat protein
MKKLYSIFLFLIFSAPLFSQINNGNASIRQLTASGKIYAVVVGISKYQNTGITQLEYADRDAKVFADYLKSKAGGSVPEENIRLLTNENATFAAVYDALNWLLDVCQKDDLVYFYFSGHGDMENNTIYKLGFLLSYNTPRNNYINNAVRLEDLNMIATTLSLDRKAKVVLITDACHSGNLAGNDFRGNFLVGKQLQQRIGNETRITSCGPDQLSNEDAGWGGGRGVFSYYLINGLTGLADKVPDGVITVDEITDYLNTSLAGDVLLAQKKDKQNPVIKGDPGFKLAVVDNASLNALKQKFSNVTQAPLPVTTSLLKAIPIQPQGYFFKLIGKNNIEEIVDFEKLGKLSKEEIPFAFIQMLTDTIRKNPYLITDSTLNGTIDTAKISQLKSSLEDSKDALKRFNEKLVVTLSDRGQEIINLYLSGDAAELERRRYYNAFSNGYDMYPKMFAVALKLITPAHPLYKILQIKQHYFSGVAARLKIPTVENYKPFLDEAMKEQLKAFELEKNAAYIHMELGTLYDYKDEFAKAEQYYLRATQIAPQWAVPWANLVGVYVNTKKYEQAKDAYKRAIELQPGFQGTYVNGGVLYQRLGNLLFSEELFRKSIKMNSRHYLPFEGLGYVYMNTTQYALADSFYYEADLRKQGFHNPRLMKLPKPLEPVIEVLPATFCFFDSLDVGKNDVLGHFAWAMDAYSRFSFPEAEREFKTVIALDPSNPLAFHYLGKMLYEQKRWKEADILFNYAVNYFLDDSLFYRYFDSLASRLPESKSKECIIGQFRTHIYARVDDHYFLATLYETWNHFTEAEKHYRKIIEMETSFVGGYYKLAKMLETIGRYKDAEQVWESFSSYNQEIAGRELNAFYKRMMNKFPDQGDWFYKAGLFLYRMVEKRPNGFLYDKKKIEPDEEMDTYVSLMPPNIQQSAVALVKYTLPGPGERIIIADKIFRPMTEGIAYLKKADSLLQADEDAMADINFRIGDLYTWQGLPERSAPYYEKTVDLKPNDANTRMKLIDVYSILFRLTDALAQLDSLHNRGEINFSRQLLMAKYCIHAGRFAEAGSLLKEAQQIHPYKIAEIADLNGRLQLLSKNPKQALLFYREYLALHPDDSLAMYTIARLFAQMKNTTEAWKWLKQSIDKGFNFYWVLQMDESWNSFRSSGKWKELTGKIEKTVYH